MKKVLVMLVVLVSFAVSAGAMDLNESINAAIKNNPTVIASQKSAAAAQSRLNQAFSAFFPTVNLNGNYNNSYTSPSTVRVSIGGVPQNITIGMNDAATVTGVQAQLSQPVFVPALYPGYAAAQKEAEAASAGYQQTVVDTTFNVTQAYCMVLKSLKYEKLMSDALNMSRSHREQVQSMLDAGMVTKADLLRSKVREANDNVDLIKSRYNISLAKDDFNTVLGNDLKQPVDLKDEGFSGKVDNLPEYEVLLDAAYANRPDWKKYVLQTAATEDQLHLSQSEYYPNVVLSANSGNQSTRYPSFNSDVNSWNVMGLASWTVFDSLGRENRIQEAAENLSAGKANLEQVKDNIALEVHSAYLDLKSALDVVIATQQAVDSAQEGFNVATSRYNAGKGTNVDVLDAQVDLTEALTDHLDALYNVEVAKAKINQMVGKKMI